MTLKPLNIIAAASIALLFASPFTANADEKDEWQNNLWLATHGIETSTWKSPECQKIARGLVQISDEELATYSQTLSGAHALRHRISIATKMAEEATTLRNCSIKSGKLTARFDRDGSAGACIVSLSYIPGQRRTSKTHCRSVQSRISRQVND